MVKLPTDAEIINACTRGRQRYTVDRELLESAKEKIETSEKAGTENPGVVLPIEWAKKNIAHSDEPSPHCLAWIANNNVVKEGLSNVGVWFHVRGGDIVLSKEMPSRIRKEIEKE